MTERELFQMAAKAVKEWGATHVWFTDQYKRDDIFGCFDMIYIIDSKVMFAQITTYKHKAERERKIFKKMGNFPPVPCELWSFVNKEQGFIIYRIRGNYSYPISNPLCK